MLILAMGSWLLGMTALAADPTMGTKLLARRFNRTGQYRSALQAIRPLQDSYPDDVDLHSILGTAYSRLGRPADAWAEFELSVGSTFYEMDGLDAHAEMFRAFGDGEAAALLRLQRPLAMEGDRAALIAVTSGIDDYRSVGMVAEAEELCWLGFSIRPQSGALEAFLADVLLDQGERDEAEFYLWLAQLHAPTLTRVNLVEARIAIADGDWYGAAEILDGARKGRRRDLGLLAYWAEVQRRSGDASKAYDVLSRPFYNLQERPDLLSVYAMVAWDVGLHAEALDRLARAQVIFPDHPDVHYAHRYITSQQD